jgi:PncC family amidohydrolase
MNMCHRDMTNELDAELVAALAARSLTIATAESCTGGAVSQAITSVPGSSAVMRGAVVAYHNDVKSGVLGVSPETLAAVGAVSEEVVLQMVDGVACLMATDCAIATSGIAGPGGGTPEKPVGTVWMAVKAGEVVRAKKLQLHDGGRLQNVGNATFEALRFMHETLLEVK